jgi:hypothetical protein
VRAGDVLLAVDGEETHGSARLESVLAARRPGDRLTYSLLRAEERRSLDVTLRPLPRGNVGAFYYLSLAGFFSLVVGTVVMLRRPMDRSSLHFYAVCVLFFLTYSVSFTGRLNPADWALFWADFLAGLFLPVVFLHFCLTFPERRLRAQRAWVVPALYMPALVLTGAAAASHALGPASEDPGALWRIAESINRARPLYFSGFFVLAVSVLLDSYRRTRGLTARRRRRLLWGTTAGAFLPGLLRPAFALGREPGLTLELAGCGPLALIRSRWPMPS